MQNPIINAISIKNLLYFLLFSLGRSGREYGGPGCHKVPHRVCNSIAHPVCRNVPQHICHPVVEQKCETVPKLACHSKPVKVILLFPMI